MSRRYVGRHRPETAPGTALQRAAILTAPTVPLPLTVPLRPPLRLLWPPRAYLWAGAR